MSWTSRTLRTKLKTNRRRSIQKFRRGIFEPLEPRLTLSVGVPTYHNDIAGTGLSAAETLLSPANVALGSFQKLLTTALDGQVYGQPLVQPGVTIAAGPNTSAGAAGLHDVAFAATEHDSLYAIDTNPTGTGSVLWKRSFTNTAVGYVGSTPGSNVNNTLGASTITTVPNADTNTTDISPEIGITSTPVIDPVTGTIYVVVKSKETIGGAAHYVQRLHAINIADGTDKALPYLIGNTSGTNTNSTQIYVYGTGDGNVIDPYNGTGRQVVQFNALRENQRVALSLVNNEVYVGWASHGDNGPYHGWIVGWNVANLSTTGFALAGVFNASPNTGLTGIWESGGRLVFEADGSAFYFDTGNGPGSHGNPTLNAAGFPADGSYYDAVIKMVADPTTSSTNQSVNGWGFKVADYFMPYNEVALDSADTDLGSGGPMLLPDSAGIAGHPHLLVTGGKEGKVYLIDRDNMGKFNLVNDNVVNAVPTAGHNTPPVLINGVLSTPAYYNGTLYYVTGYNGNAKAFSINANGTLTLTSQTAVTNLGNEPGSVSVSANGATAGIAWVMDRNTNELHAYNAASLATELWNSGQRAASADALGSTSKFASPTVANGEVFVGTSNSLVVYGATSLLGTVNISSIVVAEATPQNGILEAGEKGVITWAAATTNPIASVSLTVDGVVDPAVYGPYGPFANGMYYAGVFGPLSNGSHSYIIRVVDNKGIAAVSNGSFLVSASTTPPVISGIVVAEATAQNGILETGEKGVITWSLTSVNAIATKSVTIDGAPATAIFGPYGPTPSGAFNYAGTFGPLTAGSHSYIIQTTDSASLTASVTSTFVVAAISTPTNSPVISLVTVAEATFQNGILETGEKGVITWAVTSPNPIASKSLTVDGAPATAVFGPYGPVGGAFYYAGTFGPLTLGTHTFVIQVTDNAGHTTTSSGSFSVAAAAAAVAASQRADLLSSVLDEINTPLI